MIRLAFDVDDVISCYAANYLIFYNQANGTNFTMSVFSDYNTWAAVGISREEGEYWEQTFFDSYFCHDVPPIQGALEVLTRLRQKYELYILTARWTPNRQEVTLDWFDRFLPRIFLPENVLFAYDRAQNGLPICKSIICQESAFDCLVDDRYLYIERTAALGIEAILFQPEEYKWNILPSVLPPHVSHAKNWSDIENIIKRLFPV